MPVDIINLKEPIRKEILLFSVKKHNLTLGKWDTKGGYFPLIVRKRQILKDVMVLGLKEGIVCLPVHDAIALQKEHKDWAVETMKYT